MLDLGSYPGLVQGRDVITGEVYNIPEGYWSALDAFEGSPELFFRTRIQLSDGTWSWIYVLNGQGPLAHRVALA